MTAAISNQGFKFGPLVGFREITTTKRRKILRVGRVPNQKGVFYSVTVFICPICGREERFKERHLPDSKAPRYSVIASYDGCQG